MRKKVEILSDDEILVVDADGILTETEITLDESDLDVIKDAESKVGRATTAIANAAKLQRVALDELDKAELERQEAVRGLATKYNIPANVDWQINLTTGKIVTMPEKD